MMNPLKKIGRWVLVPVVLASAVACAEDRVVGPDETVVLNALPDEFLATVTNVIRVTAGATLKVGTNGQSFPAAGTAGFTVVHGYSFPVDASWPAVGTSETDALALFKYSEIREVEQTPGRVKLYQTGVTERQFDLYAAKWTVASDLTVSLFEHIASDVLVILDGTVIFSDVQWNCETAKKDVSLTAGEHTLVIVVATQGKNNCTPKKGSSKPNYNDEGRYGHANAQQVPGLVYNVVNADLTLDNMKTGVAGVAGTKFFENVEGEAPFSVYVPEALKPENAPQVPFVLMPRLLIDGGEATGGEVTLDLTGMAAVANDFRIHGGLQATNGATLVVKGVNSIRCGGYADSKGKHWTFFGAPVVFRHADGTDNTTGTVAFETYATVLTVPPRFTIAENTQLALMGTHVLGDGDVVLSNYDVQLQSAEAVAGGRTLTVGAGRTLSLKPCTIDPSDPWQWYGVRSSLTNNIVLGGVGSQLSLPNVLPLDVWGDVSGQGEIIAEYESVSSRSDAVTTFHGASTFEGTIIAKKGCVVFCQATPGAAGNAVVLGTSVDKNWDDTHHQHFGSVRLTSPEATIARVEASSKSYTETVNGEKVEKVNEDATVYVATNQLMRIGTWSGVGRVKSDETNATGPCSEAEIDVVDTNALVRVLLRKKFAVGTMCAGSTARLIPDCVRVDVDRMEGGAQVIVQGQTATTIGEASRGELVLRTTETIPLTVNRLGRLTFESAATVVVTEGAIQTLAGTGTLIVSNGTVRLANIAPTVNVKLVDGGRVVYAVEAVPGAYDLGDDINPALWLDADASADCFRQLSFKGHPNVVYTNDSVVVDQWFDVRPGQRTLYGFNRRCDGTDELHQQVYPYLLTNSCNGRTTMQFDRYANMVSGEWGYPWDAAGQTARAGRRMPLNAPIPAKYAIMVFGSENGGGTSVLGGWNVTDGTVQYKTPGALPRFSDDYYTTDALDWQKGKTRKVATDWRQPIFAESRPTWVDGASVDPTTTGFNGRYQILSFQLAEDGSAVPVQCLGACGKDIKDAAGQIYGEVLVFTNVLTDVQRQRVERYLSKKWGIPLVGGSAAVASPVTIDVVPGTSVELEDGGAGEIAFAGSATLAVAGRHVATGVHLGEVALAGGWLEIPALKLPWDESDVAATKDAQVGWYDPDDATRYLDRTIAGDTRPLAVDTLFSKFSGTTRDTYQNTTAFLHGYLGQADYATADANNRADRRPWRATGARGSGPSRTWLDFTVYPDGDRSGNCLRFKNVWSQTTELGNATRANQNFRTAFVVTDTSKGGGNVLCEASAGNMTPTKERSGYNAHAPIWASGSRAAITGGKTYLDGIEVNGTTQGYTGRPELLTVAATADVLLSAVGYYNGKAADKTLEHSYEIVGEMLFFKTELDDATRTGVESYLMKKWLGKAPPGYVDWRAATVTGSGTVAAPSPAYLPKFDADFTGTVSLTNAVLSFALDDTGVVTNAISLPAGVTMALPATGTIDVVGTGKVKGSTLIDAGAVEMGELVKGVPTGWTLNLAPACEGVQLKIEGGKLKLARPGGLTILIR